MESSEKEDFDYKALGEVADELGDQRLRSDHAVGEWGVYDEEIVRFAWTFRDVLPVKSEINTQPFKQRILTIGEKFEHYIRTTLGHEGEDKLMAIEFGGPGNHLFAGFPDGLFKQTFGVCLEGDIELNEDSAPKSEKHRVLHVDIFDVSLYRKLRELSSPAGGFSLIISRLVGAHALVSRDSRVLGLVLGAWYDLLLENGLMFVEYANYASAKWRGPAVEGDLENYHTMQKWAQMLRKDYSDVLDVSVAASVFRLWKKEGAPKKLPLLPNT